METISRLRSNLLTCLSPHASRHGEQELFDELMLHKPCLLNLFDVGPRNQQEQREIESGKTMVNGKPLAVNADFARQVVFVSEHLDCSERYVAGLLHTIMSENPTISPANSVEAVIVEFHQRRRHLVDSLRYILEAADVGTTDDAPRLYKRLYHFAQVEIILNGGQDFSFAPRVFMEIEHLGNMIIKVQNDKRNAVSNTSAPSAQGGNPTLGYDILNARLESLTYERRYLAVVLFLIAQYGYLSPTDIQKQIDWLSSNPNHSMTYYILTATLAAFDPVHPETHGAKPRRALAIDKNLISFMKKLAPSAAWPEPGLKAVILLKWTLFMTERRHREPSLENQDGFKNEELETQVWNAVQDDAFSYLALMVLQLHRSRGSLPATSYANFLSLSPEQEQQRERPADDFTPLVLQAFEVLVRSLITHASSELRKIKQWQEDLVLAGARSDRTRIFRSNTPQAVPGRHFSSGASELEKSVQQPPRSDVAMLYSFIGLLYSALPPERALQFWGSGPPIESGMLYIEYVETTAGKLPAFLQWAVWSTHARDVDMSMALYDMLAGLAKGQQCSELAYNFMARGGGEVIPGSMLPSSANSAYNTGPSVSWTAIFALLDSWATAGAVRPSPVLQHHPVGSAFGFASSQPWHARHSPPIQPRPQQLELGPNDVLLAQSFLRLLSTVVAHSVAVRIAVSGNAQFRAIPALISLIPLGVPLELKGALFETLAAFCEPGAGVPGVEICKAVWTLMERLEVINVRGSSAGGFGVGPNLSGKGVEVELEEVEAVYKLYPATIPFLRLLSTLIHTPKRIPLKDRVADTEPINTIPESLGQPYRLPGIGPFVTFVIDNVFSTIPNREYLRPSDRWQTNDLCLCFIERSLASYDLESLVSPIGDQRLSGEAIIPLLVHPGYDVLQRLLTNSPLQASILSYIVEGVEGFEKNYAEEEPYFHSTIVRVLRIVLRVLAIQDIFLDILIPVLTEFDSAPVIGAVHTRSYFTEFDQAMSFGPQFIPALASYVAFPTYPELVLLSIKILTSLSSSHALSNLTGFIERSNDSDRILFGFREIMDAETSEDVVTAEATMENSTGAGALDADSVPPLEQAIRLAALELFNQNTDPTKSYPNIAHFILFCGTADEQPIQDPHALGARRTCIHAILDLLNAGVSKLKGKGKERESRGVSNVDPLFVTLPALAERCYRVVYNLCVHPRTSDFTMRYLRTRENFFARQLAAIPSKAPETAQEPYIEVLYSDASRVATTVSALTSFLRLRSLIFDLVALDLHVLTNKSHHNGVLELLEIFFGNEADYYDELEEGALRPFQEVGQSYMRAIEFGQSLNFDWSDSLTIQPIEMQFFNQLNLQSCIRTDNARCEVVDRTALLSLMTATRHSLNTQGRIITPAHVEQLNAETVYILESCVVENHRRQVQHAIANGYKAWKTLLDTTLAKCFQRLPHDRRENMLFDLLHVLPATMHSPSIQESTAVLLSETILSVVTKLREDRRHQILIQSAGGDEGAGSLPAERLYTLLRSILDCIMDNSHMDVVRGNLYATLINYLHLIAASDDDLATHEGKAPSSLSTSISRDEITFSDSQSLSGFGQPVHVSASPLESGSVAVMRNVVERLVTTISRDAIDGTEVWKTIAFMSLDSLIRLSRLEKQHVVLSTLARHGILSNFVSGIKESDPRLQSVLKPDPDDLNPLYVYEAKMSLFIRMAQTRIGCERLLEARLLPALAKCDYLDARPEVDYSFIDQDTFLPSAIQRYHQLFMPALQIVDGMLATLGPQHHTVANQALDFLSNHKDTIVILLKNELDQVTLALVEEIHLIVSLCASVLPLVPKAELLSSNTGFGAIHGAILGLATSCISSAWWMPNMKPQTDSEIHDANVYASGFGTETKFDSNVRRMERLLRKAIIIYLGTASDFTEPELTLVLSPVATSQRQEERPSQVMATIPTLGDAIEALGDLCSDLSRTLQKITDLSAEIASKDHLRVDNIQEIINVAETNFLQDLDIGQKRSLICRELERTQTGYKGNAQIVLATIEMLSLLLWRHLAYYSEGQHINNPDLKASTTRIMRFLSTPDVDTLRSELGQRLVPVLQRLILLDLGRETVGDKDYIEIMCRRLKDTAGLHNLGSVGGL